MPNDNKPDLEGFAHLSLLDLSDISIIFLKKLYYIFNKY